MKSRRVEWLLLAVLGGAGLLLGVGLVWLRVNQSAPVDGEKQHALSVIYLGGVEAPEVWRVAADGSERQQLTQTGGKVYDFAASPNGSQVAYSVANAQHGHDLWEVRRDGTQARLLLPCEADSCVNPTYRPDGKQLVYSRRKAGGSDGTDLGAPAIWTLNLTDLTTDVLIPDPNIYGSAPVWSPDGRYLSFYDDRAGIRIVDFQDRQVMLVEANQGNGGAWSADSQTLFFVRIVQGAFTPTSELYAFDLQTRETRQIITEGLAEMDLGMAAPNPQAGWIAIPVAEAGRGMGKQIYRVEVDGSEWQAITGELHQNHAYLRWNPDGMLLVFQRFEGSAGGPPEVAVWSAADGQVRVLAEDAALPAWLP